jgi:tetratricopeptide (TPR) repeat protein
VKTAAELWALLHEAETAPSSTATVAMIEQVLPHTDAAGDPELSFYARLAATSAYQDSGEDAKSFVTFSWCVTDFDRRPAEYHQKYAGRLLWAFKWMAGGLLSFPEVPLSRTYAVLDDMERRYREGGHSLQAVYKLRFRVAWHIGDRATAGRFYDLWQTTPRDDLSDCAGCDPSTRIDYLTELGRDDESVEVAAPVLEGRLQCNRQPQRILTSLMVPYLRTGRLPEAAEAHRRAYRINQRNAAEVAEISDHIEFCARTGNEHRGLEILQRHAKWLDEAPSPSERMWFAARSALLLRRLTELGHGQLTVYRRGTGDVRVAALADELTATAREIAARFDARNASDRQSGLVEQVLTAEPYDVVVPLSPLARPVRPVPAPPPAEDQVPEIPAGLDADALLALAEEHEQAERLAAAAAALAAFDERFGATALTAEQSGRRAEQRAFQLWPAGDRDGALRALEEAVGHYTASGAQARLVEATISRAVLRREEGDLATVEAGLAYQAEHGSARARAMGHAAHAALLDAAGRPDDALAALDRAEAIDTGAPGVSARLALQRAGLTGQLNRLDEAAAAARVARDYYRVHGPAVRAATAHVAFGQVEQDAEAALAAFDEALALHVPSLAMVARLGRARELMRMERPGEAVEDFVEAVAIHAEQHPDDGGGPFLRDELARAYDAAGRHPEAAEVAEEALTGLDRDGHAERADDVRYLLAGLYRRLGDVDGALRIYETLIEHLTANGNVVGRAQIRMNSADLLYRIDHDAKAAERFGDAAADYRAVGDQLGELHALRRRLWALHYADDQVAGELAIAECDERLAALPPELAATPAAIWARAVIGSTAADFLLARDRPKEALGRVADSPRLLAGLEAIDDARAAAATLAATLDALDRPAEADAIRTEYEIE